MSAYVIEREKYQKFLDIVAQVLLDKSAREDLGGHIIDYAMSVTSIKPETTQAFKNVAIRFVSDMIALNYRSVGYRYREEHSPIECANDIESLEVRNDVTFLAYAKPADYQEVIRFLDCWDYQSCELSENEITKDEKNLMKQVESFGHELAHYALKKATSHSPSWGDLKMSYDGKTQGVKKLASNGELIPSPHPVRAGWIEGIPLCDSDIRIE